MVHVTRKRFPVPAVFKSAELKIQQHRASEYFRVRWDQRSQRRFDWSETVQLLKRFALPDLLQLFSGKCAYCESRIGDSAPANLEHFRPKGGALGHDGTVARDHYWWLAFEWANTLVTCQPCNVAKAGRFPVRGKRVKPLSRGSSLNDERPLL